MSNSTYRAPTSRMIVKMWNLICNLSDLISASLKSSKESAREGTILNGIVNYGWIRFSRLRTSLPADLSSSRISYFGKKKKKEVNRLPLNLLSIRQIFRIFRQRSGVSRPKKLAAEFLRGNSSPHF